MLVERDQCREDRQTAMIRFNPVGAGISPAPLDPCFHLQKESSGQSMPEQCVLTLPNAVGVTQVLFAAVVHDLHRSAVILYSSISAQLNITLLQARSSFFPILLQNLPEGQSKMIFDS